MTDTPNLRQVLRDIEVFAGGLPGFDPSTAPDTPVELFTEWLLQALRAGVREPHAMTLATADAAGDPTARVLILKDVSPEGWQFASDSGSVKGRERAARPCAALTFYWAPLARQVRVRGPVVREAPELCAADFLVRGAAARAESLLDERAGPRLARVDSVHGASAVGGVLAGRQTAPPHPTRLPSFAGRMVQADAVALMRFSPPAKS